MKKVTVCSTRVLRYHCADSDDPMLSKQAALEMMQSLLPASFTYSQGHVMRSSLPP
jgi:hypothetical protein